jgi:hypothetical protein
LLELISEQQPLVSSPQKSTPRAKPRLGHEIIVSAVVAQLELLTRAAGVSEDGAHRPVRFGLLADIELTRK